MLKVEITFAALKFMVLNGEKTEVIDGVPRDMRYIGHVVRIGIAGGRNYDGVDLHFDDGKEEITTKVVTLRRME